jgi:PST family polysaccharide transporter
MSLRQQVISGVKWSAAAQGSQQVLHFVTTAVLANLLLPSAFGLMGMALVFIGFLEIFKHLGTATAVIQRKEISEELLSSVFWLNAAFGLLVMLILIGGAPLLATIYQEPQVTPLIRVLAVGFLISGLSILQQALFQRNMNFNILAQINVGAELLGSIVAIGAAVAGAGVWSLVAKSLVTDTIKTISLWGASSWRPHFLFRWDEIWSISNYSLNLTGHTILKYFANNVDYLLIGRYLGAEALGYYTLAYRLMLYPSWNISGVIARVTFPAYVQMQDDDERFRDAHKYVSRMIAFVTFPLMLGMMAVASPFVLTLFGEEWAPVIVLLMLLAPVGMEQSLGYILESIYHAKGRTDWLLWWGVLSGVLKTVAFIIGLQWGIMGVAMAYVIVTMLLMYPSYAIPYRLIGLPVHEFVWALRRPLLNSLLMTVVVLSAHLMFADLLTNALLLAVLVSLGGLTYLLATWLWNRGQMVELFGMVKVRL